MNWMVYVELLGKEAMLIDFADTKRIAYAKMYQHQADRMKWRELEGKPLLDKFFVKENKK